ncbi:MAG: hypothetical protein K8R59_06920 [Thermoanaerobaculales bacterium]|nr:hypothetical protein [Thermoanaerobaculales bacterium]
MAYPGNTELSPQAQERVMSAFRQVVSKLQADQQDEALVGLEFVLRLDPAFAPGLELQRQLQAGQAGVDLGGIIDNLEAPSTGTINLLLVEAVEEFNQHNYLEAQEKVGQVLIDLPGHPEARSLQEQIEKALKTSTQVGAFLAQAQEAINRNDPQEAASFVMMAQALNPHHKGIKETVTEIQAAHAASSPPLAPPSAAEPDTIAKSEASASPPDVDFRETDDPHDSDTSFEYEAGSEESPAEGDVVEADSPAAPEAASWDIADAFQEPGDGEAVDADDPSSEPAPRSASDLSDLFEVSDEDRDEAAAVDSPEATLDPEPHQQEGSSTDEDPDLPGPAFDDAGSDIGDLFSTDSDPVGFSQFDATHEETKDTPSQEHAERINELLNEAASCWDAGDEDRARELVEGVLSTVPGHDAALELIGRFDQAADEAPPVEAPVSGPPPEEIEPGASDSDSQQDLFQQDFPSLKEITAGLQTGGLDQGDEGPQAQGLLAAIPWRILVLGAGGLAIVLAALWLGLGLFSGGGDEDHRAHVVSELLQEADTLFKQGNGQDALHILQTFPAEGIEKIRIDKRISKYQAALVPPTPTPVPGAVLSGRALIDEGRWLLAFEEVNDGLKSNPGDPGLAALKDEISSIEPQVVSLFSAMASGDYPTSAAMAKELALRHPDQAGFDAIIDKSLFNAALLALRSYNLTGARNHLSRLKVRRPTDEEVARILDFISSYKNRPVDMQLEIFVGSLDNR